MRSSARVLAALVALSLPLPALAGGSGGATPLAFMGVDAGARAAALGGAYSTLATGPEAVRYNPAGLAALPGHELSVMHAAHFQGVTQEYAAFAYKLGADEASPGLGVMLDVLNYGDVTRTTLSNKIGAGLEPFGIRDIAASVGYARPLAAGVSFGGAVKLVQESIDEDKDQVTALDVGLLYRMSRFPVRVGVAAQNLGPKLRYRLAQEALPLTVRGGLSYVFSGGQTAAVDVVKARDGEMTVHAGAEIPLLDRLLLRFGFNGRNEADRGLTFGLGLLAGPMTFDYALAPYGDLGVSHRLGMRYRFAAKARKELRARREPKRASRAAEDRTTREVRDLEDADWEVRVEAIQKLGKSADPAALGPLLKALGDAQDQVRAAAVEVLGRRREYGALFALQDAMVDSSPAVRTEAAIALGRLGDLRARRVLRQALQDRDRRVRDAAADALKRLK